MGVEIERKWLVELPVPDDVLAVEPEHIDQGYLVIGEASEARLRRKGGQPVLTVKSSGGLSRSEYEIELSEEQYTALWPATEGRRLVKRRYPVSADIVVDIYEGDLEGLAVAEVEFDSEQAARDYTPPPWFGEDVTEDRAYKNHQLALKGRPAA